MEDSIIDSEEWLAEKAEAAMKAGDPAAIGYLERLLDVLEGESNRHQAYSNLGIARFRNRDLTGAREAFEKAEELREDHGTTSYALGHCEAAAGKWWRALYRFTRAIYLGADSQDEHVEFLRSAAVAARHLQQTRLAEDLLLGAKERTPHHPQVLESLGRLYEQQERWLEAISVRDELIEVLKGNDPSRRVKLLSPAMESTPAAEDAETQRNSLNQRLRSGFQVVDDSTEPELPDARMSRTTHPAGLHTMIENLSRHERAVQLLETAQVIWARAHHERLDAHISPYILAAATQWIVERRHFAVPSTVEAITKDFGIAEEQLRATARQLVMQFQIEIVSHRLLMHGLGAQDGAHLARTFQAIMTGGKVDDFGSGRHLL